MTDSLGPRGKFAVLAPSTNTSVQPEFDAMRPSGVTNHHSRLVIPNSRVTDDKSFLAMMGNIRAALFPALEAALTCEPDYVARSWGAALVFMAIILVLNVTVRVLARSRRKLA